jgi:hypothetical protein
MQITQKDKDEFMLKLDIPSESKCWEWKLKTEGGYGRVVIRRERMMAHRFSWTITNGPVPTGLFVLHKCDNRKCCNPAHLFLGTIAENNADRDAKGRHKPIYGEANGLAKLTHEKARAIRYEYASGASQSRLADKFGVNQKAIWLIVHNVTWKEAA